jgi:hypothetical protein
VPALETNESELLWAGAADADAVHTGASRRLRLGRGRLAWVAPGPEVISEADTSDVRALHRSLRNAMAWVRMHAVVEMRAWPGAAPFALEIAERDAGSRAPATADERGSFEAAVLTAMRNAQTSGVFLLVEIPRNGDEDAWADALRRRLVAEAEARGAWLTSRHAASRWMVVRGDLRLAVTEAGPSRLLVNVTNPTEAAIDGLGLKLWINRPAGDIRVDAVALGQALPTVRFDRGSESAEFDLPSLSPRATLSFHVDLEEPPSDEASDLRSG